MLERILTCLKKYPAILAYIFGSETKGRSGPLSDIDIAVLVDKSLNKSELFDLRLRLSNKLSAITNKRVDLVILNNAPVQLAFEVIKNGKLICRTDNSIKVDFEHMILSKYLDRRYYDKRHTEIALRKIAEKGLLLR